MPYIVNKSDGSVLTTVGDGTINNNIASLTLIGKNYDKYGELINENFVHLLENFANSAAPSNPLAGQIWWDTFNTQLKVYTGSEFKSLAKLTSATAQPSNNKIGDLWWDTTNGQLKIYNGTSFTIIGPGSSLEFGSTGAQAEQILDVAAEPYLVVSLFSGSTRVAIVSANAEFVPVPPVPGFSSIKPGVNLATGYTLVGTADNADTLDGLNSTDFLRANANATTSGTLGVQNDTGLAVGVDSDFRVSVSGSTVLVENQTTNGSLNLKVAANASPTISINGLTALATVSAVTQTVANNSKNVATTEFVHNVIPYGVILLWSGSAAAVPSGWNLCNGTNGTPDLRDRFIVGAGNSYAVGATGGNISASASGLTTDSAGAHSHGTTTAGHTLTVDEIPSHTHADNYMRTQTAYFSGGSFQGYSIGPADTTVTGSSGGGQAHSHGINSDGAHTHTLSGTINDVRPPYYALCYIMKVV